MLFLRSSLAWRRCLPRKEIWSPRKTGPIALNFMRLGGHYDLDGRINEREWGKQFCEIARLLGDAGEEILPVAHNAEEKDLLEQLLPGHPVFFSSEYSDYFPVYAQCRGGVFNRVHGALLLAGRGAPSAIIGNDSPARMADEFGLPRYHVSEAEPKRVVNHLLEMVNDESTRARLLEIEGKTFQVLSDRIRASLSVELVTEPHGRVSTQAVKQFVFVAQGGGLGDLVLASDAIGSIKKAHPEWHVTLACRAGLAEVPNLYPIPPDEVLPIEFDPYQWSAPSEELLDALRPVVAALKSRRVDIYIAAEFQSTWFAWLLASVFRPRQALCCTRVLEETRFLSVLRESLGVKAVVPQRVGLPEETHELRRYQLLLEALGIPAQSSFPWSRDEQFPAGDYLVCFPGGSPGTKVKRWPVQNFADVLRRFQAQWRLPVTLLGGAGERDELQDLAGQIGGAQIIADASIADAAHLLAHARMYLGNDTGPAHLAAAYAVPGVAIYGGGHWPSYAPWRPGCIGLVSPMPCFGCDWDCIFGQGVCVEAVPVDEVSRAMDDVMRVPPVQAESRVWNGLDPKLQRIAQGAASKYRLVRGDLAKRLEAIYQLSPSEQRKAHTIERLEAKIGALIAAAQVSDRRITELEQVASERLEVLLTTDAALQQVRAEAGLREKGLFELTAIIGIRDGRIADLEKWAAERLTALEITHEALRDITREAEARERGLHELTQSLPRETRESSKPSGH
jgi:ADP-heptose:LPS heptosyltransferase